VIGSQISNRSGNPQNRRDIRQSNMSDVRNGSQESIDWLVDMNLQGIHGSLEEKGGENKRKFRISSPK
jgi:hypothetical protein